MSARWNSQAKRWYVDGLPLHAGEMLDLRGVVITHVDGQERTAAGDWHRVRIESRDQGRELDAYADVGGLSFKRHVAGFDREGEPWAWEGLRWPTEAAPPAQSAQMLRTKIASLELAKGVLEGAIHARNELLQTAAALLATADPLRGEPEDWHVEARALLTAIGKLGGHRG